MNNFKTSGHSSRKARKQVGDYILEKAIGFGAFSTVYEGSSITSKEQVAVKSINLHRINVSDKHLSNLKQEIDILRKCRHRNIVQLLHTYQTSNHIYLVMQYCAGGDLHRFIQRNGKMSEQAARGFSIQLANGLKYLNSLKIIHRDLKPQNILLSSNNINTTIIRIADFGFARYKPTGHNMVDTMCGSPLYMAPEILKFNKYDSKVDLWSAGTIIYQMVTKDPPFNGSNHIELLKKIENTKRLRFPPGLSDNCKDLLIGLLKRNPQQRIAWDVFFKHPWFQVTSSTNSSKSNSSTPRTKLNNGIKSDNNHKIGTAKHNNNNNNNKADAYIMINNNKILAMNSKVYVDFLHKCSVTFNGIWIKYESAKCIMKVGDVQTSREQISCALLLYLRGLDMLEDVIMNIQNWISIYTQSHKYYHLRMKLNNKYRLEQNKLDEFSKKYKQLLLDSIGCYDDHWKRGEAIQTLCATQCLQFDLNQVNIDEVIFYFAINIAKKSCSDIILNIDHLEKHQNTQNKVKECQLLLQYLITLNSISKEDKEQINKYLLAVNNTLQAIQNLK